MKTTQVKTTELVKIFKELNNNFGGNLEVLANEYKLTLNGTFGNGQIEGISLKNGISYIEFDITLNENFILSLYSTKKLPIYFAHCSKGSLTHSFGQKGKKKTLNKFQTGIVTCNRAEENVLTFQKDEPTKISLIVVNTITSEVAKGISLNQQLRNVFFGNYSEESSVFIDSYNLNISEKVKEITAIKQTGIVRYLMIESSVHLILAMEIEHRINNLEKANKPTGCLTQKEMEIITELSQFIKNNPENDYTLKSLSRKTGLYNSKLQEGFKLLHNRTVRDFIINERMKKSEKLIRTTNLNISEIVYSIGFSSRSYFSKIFRQKYNCSPKFYKETQNSLAVTA